MLLTNNHPKQTNYLDPLYCTSPLLVSSTLDPQMESEEDIEKQHGLFLALPKNLRDKLASIEISQKIQSIGRKYAFDLLRLANITRLIREYYFGEVRLEDFPKEIEKRMGVSLLTAQEIARYIKSEIIDWDPWVEYIAKLPKATVREIVSKYPKVAEQEITSNYLVLKDHPDDIFEPTIKNWLKDYVLHLGQVSHTSMSRTNYLFRSENARGLSSPEREKLAAVLKSFDENIPLPIDAERQEVVFEAVENEIPKSQYPISNKIPSPNPQISKSTPLAERPILKQEQQAFVKPYVKNYETPKFAASEKSPAQNKTPDARCQMPDTNIQFTNPYPKPGTHEILPEEQGIEMAGAAPIKTKGFFEGISSPTISSAAEQPSPPKPYVPKYQRPKNIIYPLSRREEKKPEPRIEGNIVDLSSKND